MLESFLCSHPSLAHLYTLLDFLIALYIQSDEMSIEPDQFFKLSQSFPGELVVTQVQVFYIWIVKEISLKLARSHICE